MSDRRDQDFVFPDLLPILPLRATVLFPNAVLPLAAGRATSVRLIEEAVQGGRVVGAVMQRDHTEDAPGPNGLHPVGTITTIHKIQKQSDGSLRLVVQGRRRFRVIEVVATEPYLRARIELLEEVDPAADDVEAQALLRSATGLFQKIVALSPALPDELINVAA